MEIISAVEPLGLDERRSLYKVEYSVAAKIMRIYIYVYVCICSDRILTCRIKSIRSPAKVGLVVTDLITSPVVSWEGWETPHPQHRGSAVILCSTTGVGRPLCSCGDLLAVVC